MGLFGRKSSFEKYEEQKQQEFLSGQKQEEERQKQVEKRVRPWIDALAAHRNHDHLLSEELLAKVGELPFPPGRENAQWFTAAAQSEIRRKMGRANIDASFAEREPGHDPEQIRLLRVEENFWKSVMEHVNVQGIYAAR